MLNSINKMETLWQFPGAFCGVDGCHIALKCPHGGNEARKEYYNFKNFYSVVMMGIVGADYKFLWASAGLPGSVNDACSFQACKIYSDINSGKKLPEIYKTIKGIQIPPLVLGDSAFPHHTWLQKPFTCANLTEKQNYFNYRLSRGRMVTECAFGQLKGRWRVLYRKCEASQHSLKINILACIVLHNICIDRGDLINPNLDFTYDPVTKRKRSSEELRQLLNMVTGDKVVDNSKGAQSVQNALSDYFWEQKESL